MTVDIIVKQLGDRPPIKLFVAVYFHSELWPSQGGCLRGGPIWEQFEPYRP